MPRLTANTNSRNHSQLRIINDRDSPVAYVRHINLAPVRRDGDASWTVSDEDVREHSLSESVDDGDRVAQVVGCENTITARSDCKPARPGWCFNVLHQICRRIDHAHLAGG